MTKSMLRISCTIVLLVSAFVLAANAANTVVVGTCKSGTQFSTIQAAVNAVAAGGTVFVCPGTYEEQVTISRPMTIKGVVFGTVAGPLIVAPGTGLVELGSGYAAHILVGNTTGPVIITNISVDGSGTICPSAPWVGIVFDTATCGTITGVVIRGVGNPSCVGTAIQAGTSTTLTVKGTSVHDGIYGVVGQGMSAINVTSNTFANIAFGIGVGDGQVSITNNVLAPITESPFFSNGVGMRVASNHGVSSTVAGNTIYGTNIVGIQIVQTDAAKITGNRVSAAYEAIDLEEASSAVVQSNVLTRVVTGLVVNDNGSPGGNLVTKNTVNEAACGIWAPTTPANTWLNVTNINCFGGGIP